MVELVLHGKYRMNFIRRYLVKGTRPKVMQSLQLGKEPGEKGCAALGCVEHCQLGTERQRFSVGGDVDISSVWEGDSICPLIPLLCVGVYTIKCFLTGDRQSYFG